MSKPTLWVEQFESLPVRHPLITAERMKIPFDDNINAVVFNKRVYEHCLKKFGRGYCVTKAKNITDPAVGDWVPQLGEDILTINDLIENGVDVIITANSS